MSLRVLLADESASIHKVFQMGLQDFGAEVKSVHNGLDVIEVAENYQPDIIFADILLQKKNGYEVSREIQQHQTLASVPVVLMWSSFMELDQSQYKSSGAQGELEKPFDVENMRKLIRGLVSETKSQMISDFLTFPDSISSEFVEEEQAKSNSNAKLELDQPKKAEPEDEVVEASSFFNTQAEKSDFDMYEVSNTPQSAQEKEQSDSPESWQAQPLNHQSIVPEPAETAESDLDQFQSMNLGNDKKLDLNQFLYKPDTGITAPAQQTAGPNYQIENVQIPGDPGPQQEETRTMLSHQAADISPEEKEAIIRSEVRAYLMANIRSQLPSILEQVVREELERIMQQEMAIKGNPSAT